MSFRVALAQSGAAFLFAIIISKPAAAQVVIHNFTGGPNDGQSPNGGLTQYGSFFYGMTVVGGAANDGTIFRMGTDGTAFGLIHAFTDRLSDGHNPTGSLFQSGSTFYGMTEAGGANNEGTVFSFQADGTGFRVVHSFANVPSDGKIPLGTPVVSDGVVYGMTSQGGTAKLGTVYRMNADGTGFQVIHSFTGGPGDGALPSFSSLVVSGGVIYGMTPGGGNNFGVIFRMNTDGTNFAILHTFNPSTGDGGAPSGSPTLVGDTLYGMTHRGGSTGLGTIFDIGINGNDYSNLRTFGGSPNDGAHPVGSLLFDGTHLYGSTPQGGA